MTEPTRMIDRRRLLGLVGLGAGGALLAACGGAAAPTAAPPTAAKAEPTAAPKPADAAKPAVTTAPAAPAAATTAPAPTTAAAAKPAASTGTPVKISLWWFDRATINTMTKEVLRSEFMAKHPTITVEEQLIPGGQMLTKLNTSIQSKNPPDVIYIDETYLPDLFSQKALHAIPPDVFNVEKEMGPFTAFAMKLPDGKYYALPMGWFGRSLFYNADLLKQLGYAPKDIPTTWRELIRWAKDLTKWEGERVVQTGHALAGLSAQLVQDGAFVQMGGWRWQTRKQHGLDTPEFRAARKLVVDMYDTHKLDSRKGVDSQEFFGQGKAVTMLMQGFYMGFLKTQFPNMQWGTLPKPTFTGQPPYGVYEPDVGWAVTTNRADPAVLDASWKLWAYMQGPDYMRRYCRFRGVNPSILSVQQEKQFTEEDVEWRGVALKAKPGNFTSEGYYAPQIATVYSDNFTTFVNESRPLEESVKALAADTAKAAQGYCCNYTILSKEEFQQNPAWSGGKIPIPVSIPDEYRV
jgi:multiple sugar transport system substrate-binding protein